MKQYFISDTHFGHDKFHSENSKDLPDDIGKPIKSKVDYFPSHKGCKDFEWD